MGILGKISYSETRRYGHSSYRMVKYDFVNKAVRVISERQIAPVAPGL